MLTFRARIAIIGINPYVLLPQNVLTALFKKAGKDKGPIPVRGKLDGHDYLQTLVKYSGNWRLYLNTPMREAAGKQVGDTVQVQIDFDPSPRTLEMNAALRQALDKNKKAKTVFDQLPPSRQKEIVRYINSLKSQDAIEKNIRRAIGFLNGKERFIGRDKP